MAILLLVNLYTLENKKHKAIGCPCVGGESLSQSRRRKNNSLKMQGKNAIIGTKQNQKNPQDYLVPESIYVNFCGVFYGLVGCFEKIQLKRVHLLTLLSFLLFLPVCRSLKVFNHRHTNRNSQLKLYYLEMLDSKGLSDHNTLLSEAWRPTITSRNE